MSIDVLELYLLTGIDAVGAIVCSLYSAQYSAAQFVAFL